MTETVDQVRDVPDRRARLHRARMTPALRWSLVAAGEATFILLLLPYGSVFTWSPQIHAFQLISLGLIGAAGWIAVVWRPTTLSPALVVGPLPLLAALVVTSLLSPFPSLSWPATWVTAAYAGVFWLFTVQASVPAGRRALLDAIAIVVVLTIVTFFLSVVSAWREWLDMGFSLQTLPLRPAGSGGIALIATFFADLAAVGTPVVAATLWNRGARVASVGLALVALTAIALTGTRSVLLIIAAAAAASASALFAVRVRVGGRLATAVVAAVIVIGIVGGAVVLTTSRSFDEGRSSAYASAVARVSESPIAGTGPGTYAAERMSDPVDIIGHLAFPDAHNIVLTTLAESGLIGFVGLLATVALVGWAILSAWRGSPDDRLVRAGALFGAATFAAHGMVDVVFSVVGIVVVAIAVVSLAATTTGAPVPPIRLQPGYLRAVISVALAVVVIITGSVIRTEATRALVNESDAALASDPALALAKAREATDSAPDLVPAWWMRMVIADTAHDEADATAAAHRLSELEGFGQRWISLAVLASRHGDRATVLDAVDKATDGPPVDPLVELNAIALLSDAGDTAGAQVAARRLMEVQPDIEQVTRTGPAELEAPIAIVRADVANERLAAGDPSGALLTALSAEDRELADALVARIATDDAGGAAGWAMLVSAWFGDIDARTEFESGARARPGVDRATWAWRLAGRACDEAGMSFWERALDIGWFTVPTAPSKLAMTSDASAGPLPVGYPGYVWKMQAPQRPYVAGTWAYSSGRPVCPDAPS